MRFSVRLVVVSCLFLVLSIPALALGPVDAEVGLGWWKTDLTVKAPSEERSWGNGGGSLRGEVWFSKIGLRLTRDSSKGFSDGATYTAFDVGFKPVQLTGNNFLAVGLGLQRNEYKTDEGPFPDKSSATGVRLWAEGRVGFVGILYGYGTAAYVPKLGDLDLGHGHKLEDMKGREYEIGLGVHPTPFIWIRLGYHDSEYKGDVQMNEKAQYAAGQSEVKLQSKGVKLSVSFKI